MQQESPCQLQIKKLIYNQRLITMYNQDKLKQIKKNMRKHATGWKVQGDCRD